MARIATEFQTCTLPDSDGLLLEFVDADDLNLAEIKIESDRDGQFQMFLYPVQSECVIPVNLFQHGLNTVIRRLAQMSDE
jgi:hypothetical protein